jgi:acyl carrier protein
MSLRGRYVDREAIVPTATIESLGLDSIEVVMILNGVEEKFDVYIPMDGEITEARNLAELVSIMAKQVADGAKHPSEMIDEASKNRAGQQVLKPVHVTGIGITCATGAGKEVFAHHLREGLSGVKPLVFDRVLNNRIKIAGSVPTEVALGVNEPTPSFATGLPCLLSWRQGRRLRRRIFMVRCFKVTGPRCCWPAASGAPIRSMTISTPTTRWSAILIRSLSQKSCPMLQHRKFVWRSHKRAIVCNIQCLLFLHASHWTCDAAHASRNL